MDVDDDDDNVDDDGADPDNPLDYWYYYYQNYAKCILQFFSYRYLTLLVKYLETQ